MTRKEDYEDVTVLIVDDSEFIRLSTGRMFEAAGARCISFAVDGADALRVLRDPAAKIKLMVTDIAMPTMDGIDLIRRVADLPSPPAVALVSGADPALLASAKSVAGERGLWLLGALPKPVSLADIEHLLQDFVNLKR
jgi:CheY-like chemotaxis protein